MDKSNFRPRHWWAFKHPFLASAVAGVGMFGLGLRRDASVGWAVFWALLVALGVLVMWWPGRGLLSRDVEAWIEDPDPRVRKPWDMDGS